MWLEYLFQRVDQGLDVLAPVEASDANANVGSLGVDPDGRQDIRGLFRSAFAGRSFGDTNVSLRELLKECIAGELGLGKTQVDGEVGGAVDVVGNVVLLEAEGQTTGQPV